MKNRIKDDFYSQIFKLVLPIIIQNLLSAAVSSADVVMLNYVGQSSISAVSLAAFFLWCFMAWEPVQPCSVRSITGKGTCGQFRWWRGLPSGFP